MQHAYTTVEQSSTLLKLGLDANTADGHITNMSLKGKNYQDNWIVSTMPYNEVKETWEKFAENSVWEIYPSWSLNRLIEIMGATVSIDGSAVTICGDMFKISNDVFDNLIDAFGKLYHDTNESLHNILLTNGFEWREYEDNGKYHHSGELTFRKRNNSENYSICFRFSDGEEPKWTLEINNFEKRKYIEIRLVDEKDIDLNEINTALCLCNIDKHIVV